MPPQYEDYLWRLQAPSLGLDVQLPQDLEWVDEFSWSPIQQSVETSLTGALIIQESTQLKGRPITLQGKDDMGWIPRSIGENLMLMRNSAGLTMNLQYVHYNVDTSMYGVILFQYDVMFRHYEPPPIELENVLRYDNFETDAWYKVRNLKFMEALPSSSSPCTANVSLTMSDQTGTFSIGDVLTEHVAGASCAAPNPSGVTGTVLSVSGTTLNLYVANGNLQALNILCLDGSNYATIASIP